MNTAFIACEYNPFHNGHKYHIDNTRSQGFDNIVCIMSGNFVQRGEAALFEKHGRAEIALYNGADLVIELPLKYAVSTASLFAEGFVKTAKATGINGTISFGAKNNTSDLLMIKDVIYSAEADEFCTKKIREGINYPSAMQMYVKQTLGSDHAEILSDGNNTLALEYIKARDNYFSNAGILSIERSGIMHDSMNTTDIFASASYIRNVIYNSSSHNLEMLSEIKNYIPNDAVEYIISLMNNGQCPRDLSKYEAVIMSRLIQMSAGDFAKINNVTEGLENRITDAIKQYSSTSEILDIVKTKRFTYARLRQILINAVLGITKDDILRGITYIRVLGFNDKGRELLQRMRNHSTLPVISNLSEIDTNNVSMVRDAQLDYQAGKLFSLTNPSVFSGNPEYKIPPVYIR